MILDFIVLCDGKFVSEPIESSTVSVQASLDSFLSSIPPVTGFCSVMESLCKSIESSKVSVHASLDSSL